MENFEFEQYFAKFSTIAEIHIYEVFSREFLLLLQIKFYIIVQQK